MSRMAASTTPLPPRPRLMRILRPSFSSSNSATCRSIKRSMSFSISFRSQECAAPPSRGFLLGILLHFLNGTTEQASVPLGNHPVVLGRRCQDFRRTAREQHRVFNPDSAETLEV